jgi:hypothetical protein
VNDDLKRTLSWTLRNGDTALDFIEANAVRNKLLERQLTAEDQPGRFGLKIDICAVRTE